MAWIDKYLKSYYSGNGGTMMYMELHLYTIAESIANNTTTERADLYVNVTDSSYQWHNNYGTEAYIGINGNDTTKTVAFDARTTGVKTLISTWDTVVKHDNNGKAKIGVSAHHYSGIGLGNASVSENIELHTIPRYATSNQSLNSKTETTITMNWSSDNTIDYIWYSKDNGSTWTGVDVTDGKSGTYTISGLSANTSYNIKTRVRRKDSQLTKDSSALSVTTYQYPYVTTVGTSALTIGSSQTLTLYNPLKRSVSVYMYQNDTGTKLHSDSTNSTSITFTPNSDTLYESIISSQTGNCYYYCVYSGKIAAYKYGTYKIKGTEKPTFTNFSYADINSTTVALTGNNQKLISGYSNLRITIPTSNKASGNNSAKISKYVATVAGTSKSANEVDGSTVTFGTYNQVKSNAMSVYAIDTRGLQSNTVSKTATLISYTKPVISSATNLKRVGGIGTDVNFNFSATFWNGSFGSVANTITKIEYARINAASSSFNWDSATWYTIPSERYTISGNAVKNVTDAKLTGFTLGTAYRVRIRIIDKLDSNYIDLNVTNGDITASFNKNKKLFGVGKIPTNTLPEGSIDAKGQVHSGGLIKSQGKYIMDFRGILTETGSNYTNFDNAKTTGIYNVLSGVGITNAPYTGAIFGILIVFVNDMTTWNQSNNWIWQIFINTGGAIYSRYAINNGSFTSWDTGFLLKGATQKIVNTLTNPTAETWYTVPFIGGSATARYDIKSNNGMRYRTLEGTASAYGYGNLMLGNGTSYGTAGNKYGILELYSTGSGSCKLKAKEQITGGYSAFLPAENGEIQLKPTTLYNNTTGTTGTVTLSDSVANYSYIEIMYRRNANLEVWNNHFYESTRLSAPDGKMASLSVSYPAETTTTQISTKLVLVSGTSITVKRECYANIVQGSSGQAGTQSTVYIVKVLGYK